MRRTCRTPLFASFLLFLSFFCCFALHAQDGTIDMSFGTSGKTSYATDPAASNQSLSMVLQPDGKIVQYSYAAYGSPYPYYGIEIIVTRLLANGNFDNGFGTAGKVAIPIGPGGWPATQKGLALQSDGKIVIATYRYNAEELYYQIVVIRLNADGTLDNSFGSGGKVYPEFGDYNEFIGGLAIQPNGKILVGGSSGGQFALLRLNPDGSFDNSFSEDGKISDLWFGRGTIEVIRLQPDGKILIAGDTWGQNTDFAIARFNVDGSRDLSFDNDGFNIIPVGPSGDIPYDMALQEDGKIVVTGFSTFSPNLFFSAIRLNANGTLDLDFSGDGKQSFHFGSPSNRAHTVLIQKDGKILIAGETDLNGGSGAFARLKTDGSLDSSFDGDGKLIFNMVQGQYASISDAALQMDGKIVGLAQFPGRIGLFRLNNNTALGSLPVTLKKFTVALSNSTVKLEWETSFEQNNKGFSVQRASAGTASPTWQEIGFVAGRNNIPVTRYDLTDKQPLEGTSYYRLKQVDFDGKIEYSETRVIKLTRNPIEFFVSPNPVKSGNITITFRSNYAGYAKVAVTDIKGRLVINADILVKEGRLSSPIFTGNLRPGIYTITLSAASHRWHERLVITN
jgi:uncharacterized delta-60 repeat protein